MHGGELQPSREVKPLRRCSGAAPPRSRQGAAPPRRPRIQSQHADEAPGDIAAEQASDHVPDLSLLAGYWEKAEGYEVTVSHGFTPLKQEAHTRLARQTPFGITGPNPETRLEIGQLLFGGFARCLYRLQKFDSDTERRFAVILGAGGCSMV